LTRRTKKRTKKKNVVKKRVRSKNTKQIKRISPTLYVGIILVIVSIAGLIFAYNKFLVPLYVVYPNTIVSQVSNNIPRLDIKMKSWMIDAKTNFINSLTVTPNRVYYKITNRELLSFLTKSEPFTIKIDNKTTINVDLSKSSAIYLSDETFSTYSGYVLYIYNEQGKIIFLGHVVFSSIDNNIVSNVELLGGLYYDNYGNKYYICPTNGEMKIYKSYNDLPMDCKSIFTPKYQLLDPLSKTVIDTTMI